jgi:hypothetical protein
MLLGGSSIHLRVNGRDIGWDVEAPVRSSSRHVVFVECIGNARRATSRHDNHSVFSLFGFMKIGNQVHSSLQSIIDLLLTIRFTTTDILLLQNPSRAIIT